MNLLIWYVVGVLLCVPLSIYIYYRLTLVVLRKFHDSFIDLQEKKIARFAVGFYLFAIAMNLLQNKFFPVFAEKFFSIGYLTFALAVFLCWKLLKVKKGETESKLIVSAYLVIAPTVIAVATIALYVGVIMAVLKVAELMI